MSAPSQYTYNHTPTNITSLLTTLSTTSPSVTHTRDPNILTSKSQTAHSPAPPSSIPSLVLYPHSTPDVSAILKACYEHRIAVTGFAGGTSLGGALRAHEGGVCVSVEEMTSVGDVNREDADVWCQAGVGWVELNKILEERGEGVFFPVDPAPGAKIGGMISMSCSGTNAYRYGTIADRILSLTCVLADGTVIKTRNRPRKSSAGYDLTHLIIGSEGTLALVTEAILKLAPLPKNLHVALATFSTLQQGVSAAISILKSGHQLEAIELADQDSIHAINHSGLAAEPLSEQPSLFLKFAGLSPVIVQEQISAIKHICDQHSLQDWQVSSEKPRIDVLWGARKSLGHALVRMKKVPTDLFLSTDCAVPISKLAVFCKKTDELVKAEGSSWFCANVAHAGDGNVHTAIVCPEEANEEAGKLMRKIQRLALELEGTVTGEHGIGMKLREALVEEVGESGVEVMRRVKRSLDPRGILGPGKVFKLEAGDDD